MFDQTKDSHLLRWGSTATNLHYTAAYGGPDSNGKFHNTKNQSYYSECHISVMTVSCVVEVVAIYSNGNAIADDDDSTQNS